MNTPVVVVHGPLAAEVPLVRDSPHSGLAMPADFRSVEGQPRADIVLGDRDGTTCAPEFTAFVRDFLTGHGYDVRVNDPFKGVELVRGYADPAAGRHSLQLEVNKRLYMEPSTLCKHAGFDALPGHLMALVDKILLRFAPPRAQRT